MLNARVSAADPGLPDALPDIATVPADIACDLRDQLRLLEVADRIVGTMTYGMPEDRHNDELERIASLIRCSRDLAVRVEQGLEDLEIRLREPGAQAAQPAAVEAPLLAALRALWEAGKFPDAGKAPTEAEDFAAYDQWDDRRLALVLAEPSGVQELALQVLCGVAGGGTLLPGMEEKLARLGRVHWSEGDGW